MDWNVTDQNVMRIEKLEKVVKLLLEEVKRPRMTSRVRMEEKTDEIGCVDFFWVAKNSMRVGMSVEYKDGVCVGDFDTKTGKFTLELIGLNERQIQEDFKTIRNYIKDSKDFDAKVKYFDEMESKDKG